MCKEKIVATCVTFFHLERDYWFIHNATTQTRQNLAGNIKKENNFTGTYSIVSVQYYALVLSIGIQVAAHAWRFLSLITTFLLFRLLDCYAYQHLLLTNSNNF